jgi:hypothetical protein
MIINQVSYFPDPDFPRIFSSNGYPVLPKLA